ncbi:MAG: MAPEG family protein [Pseudomonadota bacterium]
MPVELSYLVAFTGVAILTIVVQEVIAAFSHKPSELVGPRDDFEPTNVYLLRARRAMQNTIEAMVMFAPLVLVAHAADRFNATTELAAAVFFWARALYLPAYVLAIPLLRSTVWGVGFVATLVFFVQILPFS